MKGYSATTVIPPEAQKLYAEAARHVARLPEFTKLRCHELARAVQKVLGAGLVVDGHYGPCEHSWIAFPRWLCILDVYALAAQPMVQLVSLDAPFRRPYREGKPRTDINERLVMQLAERMKPSEANEVPLQAVLEERNG